MVLVPGSGLLGNLVVVLCLLLVVVLLGRSFLHAARGAGPGRERGDDRGHGAGNDPEEDGGPR